MFVDVSLFGFDVDIKSKRFGVWCLTFNVECANIDDGRSIFGIHYFNGDWVIDILWFRIIDTMKS